MISDTESVISDSTGTGSPRISQSYDFLRKLVIKPVVACIVVLGPYPPSMLEAATLILQEREREDHQ